MVRYLNTGQMDANLIYYVLVSYLNGLFSTYYIGHGI